MTRRVTPVNRRRRLHELKRRLMRAMSREGAHADHVARQIRAHACACAFARGRSLEGIALDSDLAAGWDARTVESEIRTRLALKR